MCSTPAIPSWHWGGADATVVRLISLILINKGWYQGFARGYATAWC